MKRILLVIGFNLVELGLFVFVPYWVGLFVRRLFPILFDNDHVLETWGGGLGAILMVLFAVAFLWSLLDKNLELVDKITGGKS